jgi:hypothetical protein
MVDGAEVPIYLFMDPGVPGSDLIGRPFMVTVLPLNGFIVFVSMSKTINPAGISFIF